jgi:hypothetical protein
MQKSAHSTLTWMDWSDCGQYTDIGRLIWQWLQWRHLRHSIRQVIVAGLDPKLCCIFPNPPPLLKSLWENLHGSQTDSGSDSFAFRCVYVSLL